MDVEEAYRTLGLPDGAGLREVLEAHRDLLELWDPQRFEDNPRLEHRAVKERRQINEAFELLRVRLLPAHPSASDATGPSGMRRGRAATDASPGGPNLLEDALGGKRSRGTPRWVWPGILLGVLTVVLIILLLPGSEDPIRESDPAVDALPADQSKAPIAEDQRDAKPGDGSSEFGIPAPPAKTDESAAQEMPAGDRASQASSPTAVTPAVRTAFEILEKKSAVVRSLVSGGKYVDLTYQGWRVVSTRAPEIVIAVQARRSGAADSIDLVWSVDLSLETIRAVSPAAIEFGEDGPEQKPNLVRGL